MEFIADFEEQLYQDSRFLFLKTTMNPSLEVKKNKEQNPTSSAL